MSKKSNEKNNSRPNLNSTASIGPSNIYLTSTPSSLPPRELFDPLNISISSDASVTIATSSATAAVDNDREISSLDLSPIREQFETLCISSDNDDEVQQTQQSIITEPDALVSDSSASSSFTVSNSIPSEKEIEDDLFNNIKLLIQGFLSRPSRQYPYYRIMQWKSPTEPQMEHSVTVVISQPSIIL